MNSTQKWTAAGNGLRLITAGEGFERDFVAKGIAVNDGIATFCASSPKSTNAFSIGLDDGTLVRAPLASFESTKPHRFRPVPQNMAPNGVICGFFRAEQAEMKAGAWILDEGRKKAKAKSFLAEHRRPAIVGSFTAGGKVHCLISHVNGVEVICDGQPRSNPFDPTLITCRPETSVSADGKIVGVSYNLTKAVTLIRANGKDLQVPFAESKLDTISPSGLVAITELPAGRPPIPHLFRPDGGKLTKVELPKPERFVRALKEIRYLSDGWFIARTDEETFAIGSLKENRLCPLALFLNLLDYTDDGSLVDDVHGIHSGESGLLLLLCHSSKLNLVHVTKPERGLIS